jgi:hypothetical protein
VGVMRLADRLQELAEALELGLVTPEEFSALRGSILSELTDRPGLDQPPPSIPSISASPPEIPTDSVPPFLSPPIMGSAPCREPTRACTDFHLQTLAVSTTAPVQDVSSDEYSPALPEGGGGVVQESHVLGPLYRTAMQALIDTYGGHGALCDRPYTNEQYHAALRCVGILVCFCCYGEMHVSMFARRRRNPFQSQCRSCVSRFGGDLGWAMVSRRRLGCCLRLLLHQMRYRTMRDLCDGEYLRVDQFDRRQTRWALGDDMDVSVEEKSLMMLKLGYSDSENEDDWDPGDQEASDRIGAEEGGGFWGDSGDLAC